MGKSKKPIEIFVHMIYLMYFSQQNDINMDFKSQTPNSEFLTEDQEKLFWAQRAMEKFKEYDKKRTAYVHQLEHDYQSLRKSYDELENDMYGDAQDMTRQSSGGARKFRLMIRSCQATVRCSSCKNVTWLTVNTQKSFRLLCVITMLLR